MLNWPESPLGLSVGAQDKLLSTLAIVAVLGLLQWLALSLVGRRIEDVRERYRWRKTITYVGFALGLFLVGRIWIAGLRDLTTTRFRYWSLSRATGAGPRASSGRSWPGTPS